MSGKTLKVSSVLIFRFGFGFGMTTRSTMGRERGSGSDRSPFDRMWSAAAGCFVLS